jgi:hypothetical protein
VFDIARIGDRLFVGGLFERAGGAPATNLAAIDPATGARLPVTVPVLDGQVNALEQGASRLFVGGQFAMAGYRTAPGFAAIGVGSTAIAPGFAPRDHGAGRMTAGAGRLFLSSLHFQGYDPAVRPTKRHPRPRYYGPETARSTIRAVDPLTGATVTTFKTKTVAGLSGIAADASRLMVVRRMQSRVRFPRNRLLVIDPVTGAVKRSSPLPLPGYVANLRAAGGFLYAAGSFRRFRPSGQPAHLAIIKLNPADGSLDDGFDPNAHGPVYDLEAANDRLYFTGLFDHLLASSTKLHGIAAVQAQNGVAAADFTPPRRLRGTNYTDLTALHDDVLFSGGVTRFLDAFSGAINPAGAAGYARRVDAAVATSSGITYSATIFLPLGGYSENVLSFASVDGAAQR